MNGERTKSGSQILQKAVARKKKDFKGFSIRWMASQVGVSHVYLSQILRGLRPIPLNLIEPLCEILDLDIESKARLLFETSRAKGYRPLSESKKKQNPTPWNWNLVPVKDFDLLSRWETMAIMLTTLLKDYDGTPAFIAERLFLPEVLVVSVMESLEKKGYLTLRNGLRVASKALYEYQASSSREQIRNYHLSVLRKATSFLEKKNAVVPLDERLFTSAAITCSREDIARLKEKFSDFLKEFVEEAATPKAEEVYQIGIQFFPVTR